MGGGSSTPILRHNGNLDPVCIGLALLVSSGLLIFPIFSSSFTCVRSSLYGVWRVFSINRGGIYALLVLFLLLFFGVWRHE